MSSKFGDSKFDDWQLKMAGMFWVFFPTVVFLCISDYIDVIINRIVY